MTTERLFTTFEVARLLGMDPSSVVKWINQGKLRGFATPGGHRRVRLADLRAFVREYGMPMPSEIGPSLDLLVIDTDPQVHAALAKAFRPHSDRVLLRKCTSGIEGVIALAEEPPAFAMVELGMPDLNAIELLHRAHARSELKDTRFLLTSGQLTPRTRTLATEAGAEQLLARPLDTAAVVAWVLSPRR